VWLRFPYYTEEEGHISTPGLMTSAGAASGGELVANSGVTYGMTEDASGRLVWAVPGRRGCERLPRRKNEEEENSYKITKAASARENKHQRITSGSNGGAAAIVQQKTGWRERRSYTRSYEGKKRKKRNISARERHRRMARKSA